MHLFQSILGLLGRAVIALALLLIGLWGTGALAYNLPGPTAVRAIGAGLWAAGTLWAVFGLLFVRGRRLISVLGYLTAVGALVIWWGGIEPTGNRDWAPEVSRQTTATVDGSRVTLHDVRDFRWTSESTFTENWITETVDLDQIDSVDLFLSYWSSEAIAHTLVSFGFTDGQRIVFSAEIRRTNGQSFSSIAGFFKQYELALLASREDDIIRLRTNARGEDVRMYPIPMQKPLMRSLFLSYVMRMNDLADAPAWYDTIFANCTTVVFDMVRSLLPRGTVPLDPRILLSGLLPSYLQEIGALPADLSRTQIRAGASISGRAQALPEGADFSQGIRAGGWPVSGN